MVRLSSSWLGSTPEAPEAMTMTVSLVLVADDIATDDNEDGPGRRGTGATILVEKVAGAAAYRGDEDRQILRRAIR